MGPTGMERTRLEKKYGQGTRLSALPVLGNDGGPAGHVLFSNQTCLPRRPD